MLNSIVKQGRSGGDLEKAKEAPTFLPAVDVRENEQEVTLVADMPGVDEKSVSVDVESHTLTIRGEFTAQPPKGYTLNYREYETGNYEREFTLGDSIDRDKVEARVANGVLRLRLPKAQEAKPRQIEVKAG